MKNILSKNKGVTLLELLIAMAIFVLIIGIVGTFARDLFYYDDLFSKSLTSYDEARKILQPVSSEIRSASVSSLGSYPIETATNTSFVFFTDLDNNGTKEKVRYFLADNILKKGVIIPSGNPFQYLDSDETVTEIIHGVNNNTTPIFTYFDSSYTGNSSPLSQPVSILAVRLIKITLIIDANPNKLPAPITVTTQINIRNLKDNL
jgi:prepilin-type N-terminal cleavage/methylation domain-containing protein